MPQTNHLKRLDAILRIDDLDSMLTDRERLRHLYASLQVMYMATHNELFSYYMQIVADSGSEINHAIEHWCIQVQNEASAQGASWEAND